MWRDDYHYDLPEHLIAQRPAERRQGSRLMNVPTVGTPTIGPFTEIVEQFRGDEILVVNDTRVVPARIKGHKTTGGAAEVFFVESRGKNRIKALVRGKRMRPGTVIELPQARATIIEPLDQGAQLIELEGVTDLWNWLEAVGEVPLPPYIKRDADHADRDRYQTVFAENRGAVAAPTAGLHFTDGLLDQLRTKGVTICTVTLHVGLGTFMPVRTDDLDTHVMHTEHYVVPEETSRLLASDRPVVALGTTVVRALESYARNPQRASTDIFIRPGFEFKLVDGLITNFHLPESTLLMLVSALVGRERILEAYGQAVEAQMRFFSYGDAMLLRREGGTWA